MSTDTPDIRTLLTARSRTRVPPRDASLTGKRSTDAEGVLPSIAEVFEESTELAHQVGAAVQPKPFSTFDRLPRSQSGAYVDEPVEVEADLASLQRELESLPQIGKRLAIHLEETVRSSLIQLCDRHDLTPETFLEAAIVLLQQRPELTQSAIASARVRLSQRKRAGLIRRTLSLVQKHH